MSRKEDINGYIKNYIYEQYTRIVYDYKNYDNISRKKMLKEIYNVYSDYHNIIDICTVKELKYLKMILENNIDEKKEDLFSKYEWERRTLYDKFLIDIDFNKNISIPIDIIENVKLAIKNTNWKKHKEKDELNEYLVGYCKIQGSSLLNSIAAIMSGITGIDEEKLWTHMLNNKLFNYYVLIQMKNFEALNQKLPIAISQDYYEISDELEEQRAKQGVFGHPKISLELYKTMFYNDFNIKNKKIKKLIEEVEELPCFTNPVLKEIRYFAMLNIDRQKLKQAIKDIPVLKNTDLTDFFKTLDNAMNEMTSGALNGFTPNEAKEIKVEKIKSENLKEQNYTKQINACISKQDAKLFYKIYFALLEFTNKKYNIKPKFKLYNKLHIDPYDIQDIVNKFWEEKEQIVLEFCNTNPYKFNEEELKITNDFKKGIRNLFIIVKFEKEYTAIMDNTKCYMIKGINDNIDNIISYKNLPFICITSIIPFKKNLIYDGLFFEFELAIGGNFEKIIQKDYDKNIKYYHL